MAALGGQVAGVQITQTDGTPGAGFDIKIRGVGTLNGDATPFTLLTVSKLTTLTTWQTLILNLFKF